MSVSDAKGRLFTFLLTDRFGMFSLSAFIDCMRSANRLSGKDFYSWKTVSATGGVVTASNNMRHHRRPFARRHAAGGHFLRHLLLLHRRAGQSQNP